MMNLTEEETVVKNRLQFTKVGFIGAGNMAKAIGGGMINKGIVGPRDIYVSAPSDSNLKWWQQQDVNTTHSNVEIVKTCKIVVLAMKPQYLDSALQTLSNEKQPLKTIDDILFISVLAGVTTQTLQKKLSDVISGVSVRVIRVMPNTPMLVGAGCAAYCASDSSNNGDKVIVSTCFSLLGVCVEVKEEMMDAVSSISGCGPAFMFLMIEGLADGGVRMGVPREMAQRLAAQTMLGAAQMVLETGRHPGQLKDDVCSAGGSTIAGVHALEKYSIRAAMIAAVEASTMKNQELGKK